MADIMSAIFIRGYNRLKYKNRHYYVKIDIIT